LRAKFQRPSFIAVRRIAPGDFAHPLVYSHAHGAPLNSNMSDAPSEFAARYAQALARLYDRARAARWNLSQEVLAEAAARGALKSAVENDRVEAYLDALHAEDLALALACKDGNSGAWEQFIASMRPPLYAAARAVAGDEIRGRELADSLWADLYGLEVRDGRRRSLLEYFHGRSSILTWARAILAQRHVDYIRSQSRTQPLDDEVEGPRIEQNSNHDETAGPERARYVAILAIALDLALKTLALQDRMRMAYYYRHELSLKEIGRLMNEHESTVSRKLARTRDQLKSEIERRLRDIDLLSQDQIRLCYDFAAGDLQFDLARALPDSQ
jgi:RNA polymerase sigma-70 factor (ECF subfamily)